jgi:hypothetical protein
MFNKERYMQTVILNTDGKRGLWSNVAKAVEIVDMRIGYCTDEKDFGELCVYFNTDTWDIEQDGLIYTDTGFMAELQAFLKAHGLAGDDVDYSEQGMQGDDYVSCDVGKEFIDSWLAKFGEHSVAHLLD